MRRRWMGDVLGLTGEVLVIGVFAIELNASALAQPASPRGPVRPDTLGAETVRVDVVHRSRCRQVAGVGSAPTERLARLQAWERIAQATGNWPVPADTLRKERYDCRKAGAIWQCRSAIEVCRST